MTAQELREQTCCFTGHRNVPKEDVDQILDRVEMFVLALAKKGVTYFGVGGALGFDTLVAQHLFWLRDVRHLKIKVILVYPFDGFTSRWSPMQKADYQRLLPKYDKVVCVCDRPSKEAYLKRDRHLVDGSAHCIAYCTRNYGGTAYTVRYAIKNGLSVLNTADYDITYL